MNPPSSSPPPSLAPPHSDDYSEQSPPDGPSLSYLEFASMPSKTLSEPTRKLLILDLNGTLLRSPRALRSYRGRRHQHPAPRRVMPRAYLTAFRAYLFAPRTRAWLDVMVWSSAQPHSVEDMMLDTFGRDRDNFLAIWAQGTLGLTEDRYRACGLPSPQSPPSP
jgi:NLI interacting factor-like phosphatase